MRWNIERRLSFIDFRLYWEGRINRKDLTEFFSISVPQASADLRKYQETAPKNVHYDKSGKFYFASSKFKPAFIKPNSSDYLSQLRLISEGILKEGDSFLGSAPLFDTVTNPARSIEPEILREILKAIKEKMSLEIEYQSMSRPQPVWRRIVPHILAYDGFRWHVRAYCYIRKTYRDFLLARVLNIRDPKPDKVDSSADMKWHDFLNVRIVPHPELSIAQQRTIQRDYGMRNGSRTIRVRAALYFYFERQLGLDEGCELRPPHVQQIVLANRNEIQQRLARYNDEKES